MAEQNYSEDVDLSYLMRKFNNFFKKCIKALFAVLGFFVKYWLVTVLLIIAGIGYGYYKESKKSKIFTNEGIVIPNFESVDYLYATIEELNSRIKTGDTVFLKEILGENARALRQVEIEPISDIYNLMTRSREQIDVFRILYQNQDFDKFIDNIATSKYFKYHKINFVVRGENKSQEVIDAVLTHWNSNQHFREYESIFLKNAQFQVKEYQSMIAQVDSVIKAISASSSPGSNVVISDNTNLHMLLVQKKELLDGLLQAEIKVNDYTEPVKIVYMDYDVEVTSISDIFKYPVLFVLIFGFLFFIRFLYKRLKQIAES